VQLPAKLTRPRANALLPRKRVFQLLDASDGMRWTWITAPAGAGKTSLASSWIESKQCECIWYQLDGGEADPATFFHYLILQGSRLAGRRRVNLPPLTPEFLPGLDFYARQFFEQIFGLYSAPFVVVLDNVHEVPAGAPLASVLLGVLLDSLPANGRLLCLSRQNVPPTLVRWTTQPGFQQLRWEDLSLTEEEAVAIARSAGYEVPDIVAKCNRWIRGWVAGLKLLLRASPEELEGLGSFGDAAAQGLFDYYAQEVFERVAPGLRDFLVRAAVLSNMEPDTAAALTGREDAASVLLQLYGEQLFIERRLLPSGPSYQFHPLFHNFLRSRLLRSHSTADIAAMKTRAAASLEKRGLLESATALALECDDPELLVRLILAQAPQLFAQGRSSTLENWVRAVPESIRDGNGWLPYWLGVSSSLRDSALGRASLERAFSRFQQAGDMLGAWLTVASIIQIHFMGWGAMQDHVLWQWVDVFEGLRTRNGGSIPKAIEIQVLNLLCLFAGHCPEHTLSRHLVGRALVLAPDLSNTEDRMGIGGLAVGFFAWRGDEASAWALLEQLAPAQASRMPPTAAGLTFDVWRGALLWTRSEHERCSAAMTEARVRYREAGLGVFECMLSTHQVLGALSAGDWAVAGRVMQESLASLRAFQVVLRQWSEALQAMQLSLGGQTAAGLHIARKSIAAGTLAISPSTTAMTLTFLASAFLEAGSLDEAADCAGQALEGASRLPSDRWLFDAYMLLAGVEFERADEEATLNNLRKALALAAARDFRGGVSLFQPLRTAKLLAFALRHGIEAEYVKRLIRHRKILAPRDADTDELWPVRIRVRTLGQFSLWIDEQAVARVQQATRKPLEVLKALIGLGPSSLATLGSALWPDLDGAAAHNACHVAIHRLRKILGEESAISITHGMVALNGEDAWVDVEVFRRLANRIRKALSARVSLPELDRLVEQLLMGYPGHFLPEEEHAWAIAVREQLRARFVHLAIELSAALERCGAAEAAIALNRHCIELDPLMESFHRALITGLISLGRKAEALEAFRHCRAALMAGLRVEPSEETCALQARIRRL
jgi:ATP/maltotriose-dependent transcriptional regulator MalT/DNA-binding SARP family transcriptional activator